MLFPDKNGNRGSKVLGCFLDAFDRVDHGLLFQKLEERSSTSNLKLSEFSGIMFVSLTALMVFGRVVFFCLLLVVTGVECLLVFFVLLTMLCC